MSGIDLEVIIRSLKIDMSFKLIVQKKKNFILDSLQAIDQEVKKLLEDKFILEVN